MYLVILLYNTCFVLRGLYHAFTFSILKELGSGISCYVMCSWIIMALFILCPGNKYLLSCDPTWRSLLRHYNSHNVLVNAADFM